MTGMGLGDPAQDAVPRTGPVCLALEALQAGGGDSGLSLSLAAHLALCLLPIAIFGSPDHRRRYLPPLASGRWIGGLAISEPAHGSDATGLETSARAVDGGFSLQGMKSYVTNGSVADVLVVLARTGKGDLGFGLTAFVVEPRTTPGIIIEDVRLSGFRSCRISNVEFAGAIVPASQVLGRLGAGFHTVARRCFDFERSITLAPVVGEMQRSLEHCIGFASSRRSGRAPIVSFGQVQRRLANMRARLDSARWALYRCAWEQENGIANACTGPATKKIIAEGALRNAADAIQVMGAAGALEDGPVARSLHDARLVSIAGGTLELQEQSLVAAMLDEHRERRPLRNRQPSAPR